MDVTQKDALVAPIGEEPPAANVDAPANVVADGVEGQAAVDPAPDLAQP